jgi:hypothetical protein
MKIIDEYRQNLVEELIEHSANIDLLVVQSRQMSVELKNSVDQALEELRAKLRDTTAKLHELEGFVSNSWENIGGGG